MVVACIQRMATGLHVHVFRKWRYMSEIVRTCSQRGDAGNCWCSRWQAGRWRARPADPSLCPLCWTSTHCHPLHRYNTSITIPVLNTKHNTSITRLIRFLFSVLPYPLPPFNSPWQPNAPFLRLFHPSLQVLNWIEFYFKHKTSSTKTQKCSAHGLKNETKDPNGANIVSSASIIASNCHQDQHLIQFCYLISA